VLYPRRVRISPLLLLCAGLSAAPLTAAEDPVVAARQAFLSAKMAEADGRFEAALGDFRKAVALRPDDPVLHFETAVLLQQMGVEEDARKEAGRATELDPDFEPAWRLAGAIDLTAAEKQPERALTATTALENAHRLSPQNPSTAAALARAYLLQGRPDRARATLGEVPGLAENPAALKIRAEADDKRGADDEARKDYQDWLAQEPGDREATSASIEFWESQREYGRAVELLRGLRHGDVDATAVRERIALDLLRAGRFAEAEKEARDIVSARPEDRGARRTVAAALDAQGRAEESAALLRKLADEDPDDPTVALTLAFQLSGQGKGKEAVALLQAFVSRIAGNAAKAELSRELRSEIAALLYRDRNFEDAKTIARATAVAKGGVAERSLGILLERSRDEKKPAEGLAWAKQAAAADPKNPEWKASVAEFQIRAGERAAGEKTLKELSASGIASDVLAAADAEERLKNFEAASAIAGEGLARFAGNTDLMFRRGSSLERLGKFEEAGRIFEAILKIHPDDANTLNYLGYMYADKGVKLGEARTMIERAVALDPQNGAYLDSLGWVCFRQNELPEAEKYLGRAASRIPSDATVQEHLGDLHARRGQTAEAVAHWKKSLALSPEEPEKIEKKIHDSGAAP